MPKPPIDTDSILKAINAAMESVGMSASKSEIQKALKGVTKSGAKSSAKSGATRRVPKITAKTATGGAGRKPPKPPKTVSAAAPKPAPKGPKTPKSGVAKPAPKITRAAKREQNIAKHYAEREKWLADKRLESQTRKEATRAENRAAWAKRQDEMEARRLAGREKYNKKKGTK
jgi:hypothetical protein